jgi:hypothetical protein
MSGTGFTAALFVGSAIIALWFSVRFPRLAPSRVGVRVAALIAASIALQLLPIDASTSARLFGSLFLVALPLLSVAWLTAIWLLQSLQGLAGPDGR